MAKEIELTEEEKRNEEYEAVFFADENEAPAAEPEEDPAPAADPEPDPEVDPEPTPEEDPTPEPEADPDPEGDEDPEADPDPEENKGGEDLISLKWNGEDVQVTREELIALGQKGFDYTAKMQNVAKYRKELEAAGVTDDTIELMKRIKGGDKAAVLQYLKDTNFDPVDLIGVDENELYAENDPNTLRKEANEFVISDQVAPIMEQVRSNPVLMEKMSKAEDLLPNAVIMRMAQDPAAMYQAVTEIDSGDFDQVMPRVQIRLAGMNDLDREFALNTPDIFGQLYAEEKHRLMNGQGQQTPEITPDPEPKPAPRAKPNMAEVGVKKSNTASRHNEVIKDAFNDDGEYQKILQRVRNSR